MLPNASFFLQNSTLSSYIDQEVYFLLTGEEAPNGIFDVLNLKSWQSYSQKSVTLWTVLMFVDRYELKYMLITQNESMKQKVSLKCPYRIKRIIANGTSYQVSGIYIAAAGLGESCSWSAAPVGATGSQPANRCWFSEVSFHFAHSLFHCIIVKYCCCPEFITQNNRYHTIPSNTLR